MASNVFIFESSTGFVGIGTLKPTSMLDVRGTITASNFSGLGAGLTNLNASAFTTGTMPAMVLPPSGVISATYGSASSVAQLSVDATGRVTSAASTAIAVPGAAITSGTIPAAVLPPSGVTPAPATYGSGSAVGQVTVDATGRITSAANTAIAVPGAAITSGTIPAACLPPTGVTPATYGSGSTIPQISVDAYGRITAASSVALSAQFTPNMLVYTSPGTWTIPPGTTRFRITAVGAGGDWDANGVGGGGGGTIIRVFTYVPGQNTVSYTVGAFPNGSSSVTYNGETVSAFGGGTNPPSVPISGGSVSGTGLGIPGGTGGVTYIGGDSFLGRSLGDGSGSPFAVQNCAYGGGDTNSPTIGNPGVVIIEH